MQCPGPGRRPPAGPLTTITHQACAASIICSGSLRWVAADDGHTITRTATITPGMQTGHLDGALRPLPSLPPPPPRDLVIIRRRNGGEFNI